MWEYDLKNVLILTLLAYSATSAAEWVQNKHGTFYELPPPKDGNYIVLIEREYKNKSDGDKNGYNKEIIRKIDCGNRKEALVIARRYKDGNVDKIFDYEAQLGLSRLLKYLNPITLKELQTAGICPH